VRESLKHKFNCSPDPKEVQAEMTRDKGYGGKRRKNKTTDYPHNVIAVTSPRHDFPTPVVLNGKRRKTQKSVVHQRRDGVRAVSL